MNENIIKTKILLACDTLANWTNSARELGKGEVALAIDGENIVLRVGKEGGVVFSEAQKLTLESLAAEKVILSAAEGATPLTVQAAIDALSTQVAGITVEELSAGMATALSATFDAKGAAGAVHDELTAISTDLAGDINALEGRMTTAEGDIDALEGRMTTVEGRMLSAEGDIDDLEGRMTTAEGAIDTLTGQVAVEQLSATLSAIFDTKGAAGAVHDELTDVSAALDGSIDGLHSELTTVSAELAGDIGELRTDLTAYTVDVEKLDSVEDGYFATYVIKQGGSQVGDKINIPKDFLVKSATVKTADGVTPCGGEILPAGTKYIDFVINTIGNDEEETHIHIKLSDLIDPYTGHTSETIDLDVVGNVISAEVVLSSIDTKHIKDGAITTEKIALSAVTTDRIADEAVTTAKLSAEAVTAAKLATDAVETVKIKAEAVTDAKIATDAVTTAKIKDGAVTAEKLADGVIPTYTVEDTTTINLELSGTQFTAEVIDESIAAAKLATDAVTTVKIANAAVTGDKIATSSITQAHLTGEFVFDCGNATVEQQ